MYLLVRSGLFGVWGESSPVLVKVGKIQSCQALEIPPQPATVFVESSKCIWSNEKVFSVQMIDI